MAGLTGASSALASRFANEFVALQSGSPLLTDAAKPPTGDQPAQSGERRFCELLQALPAAVYTCDASGRIDTFNAACVELWGRAPRVGVDLWCGAVEIYRLDGSQLPLDQCPMAIAIREDRPAGGEELIIGRPDGSRRHVIPHPRRLFDAQGRLTGAINMLIDVTDQKRAELGLRESEARLRLAVKSGKLGIWEWDIASDHVTWNDSLYEIHGQDRASFPATTTAYLDLIHPDDRKPVERAIQSSLEHDVPYELEFRVLRPGGGIVWLFTNAVVVRENGRPVRMLGASFDITARKHAELGLRESELRFRTLANHAPVGIFLTGVHGHALFLNDTWCAMAGITADQMRGKLWTKALHPDDRDRVTREWLEAVNERRRFDAEYRYQRPDGTITWLQGSTVEFRNARGEVTGFIGTVVDITSRKAVDDALRESEKRFRTLASHAPVGIFQTDASGETVFVNESWCAMTGLTVEEAMGRGWIRAMHEDDRARVAAEWASALSENRASAAEYRFVHADGSISWVQGNAVQLHDDAGRLVGYIGTVSDLTQRKAAEERLRAREEQLRLITTNAPIILAHCDREERYLFVNRAYTERFRCEPETVLGRTVRDVLGPEAHAELRPQIERVLNGETVTFEIEIPYRDLGRRFMRAAYTPDVAEDGSVRGFLCAISDLTERRAMEIALGESEARFRQLADSMPQIVFAADANGKADYYNRRWFEFTGATEGVSGDESFLPILHPDDRQRCLDAWYGSVASGKPYQIEYRFHSPAHGEYRWFLGRALPVRDEQGRIVRWFGTATDIHDWKLVQEELRQAQAQLQAHADELEVRVAERTASLSEAVAQMEEFSYSVSHDLRAPLRAMNAYAQALAEDYGPQLDDTARNYVERIQRSSVRMEKLTHDVLTYSRVARAEIELTELNLELLLRDVVMQYRELQPPAANLDIAAPLLGVRGHESSLGQCLANLLTNAAKFVEPGETPRICVRTEPAGDRVRVWIEDNGIGIAPEYQARLFRVFERVPTRHAYDGTGIGLAIVRKATEKMGGDCGVVSGGPGGSRFWIELPKSQL